MWILCNLWQYVTHMPFGSSSIALHALKFWAMALKQTAAYSASSKSGYIEKVNWFETTHSVCFVGQEEESWIVFDCQVHPHKALVALCALKFGSRLFFGPMGGLERVLHHLLVPGRSPGLFISHLLGRTGLQGMVLTSKPLLGDPPSSNWEPLPRCFPSVCDTEAPGSF